MPPIFSSTGAQTRHPRGQIELEPDRDSCATPFLLIYYIMRVTIHVEGVNAHRDMNSRDDRGLGGLVRLLHLIGRQVHDMDYHHWKETHTAPFAPADPCPPLDVSLIGWHALAGLVSKLRCRAG